MEIGEKNGESADNGIGLHLPTIVSSDIQEDGHDNACLDLKNAIEEKDDGWMNVNFNKRKRDILELTSTNLGKRAHLIWPTDSF
eukprot:CCRYP_009476-RA/>CCRYP_009476-RA protein AED:0.20 eAED:0.20 QI:880/0/0.5/1/0/0/2/0/83